MLGYVTCEKPEMKIRDFEIYSGYYCGVCKSLGRRYGQFPRMLLSYDAAFLGLVLAALELYEDNVSREHCIIHHIKKKTIIKNEAIDYAADIMIILAWFKIKDDIEDEGKIYARALRIFLKKSYNKIKKQRAQMCEIIEKHLVDLSALEEEKCDSLDQVAEPFAKIMEEIFKGYDGREERTLSRVGYFLGKWIYLMDAWEDIEENLNNDTYNPLIYRYKYEEGRERQENFRKRIYNDCERNLLMYLSEIGRTVDLLNIKKNKDIIENIVYMGLLRRTENVLGKEEIDGKSL